MSNRYTVSDEFDGYCHHGYAADSCECCRRDAAGLTDGQTARLRSLWVCAENNPVAEYFLRAAERHPSGADLLMDEALARIQIRNSAWR